MVLTQLWQRRAALYNGLLMRCSPGTHEMAMSLLLRNSAPRAGVLDLGAGTGAWLSRMRDASFTDLNAVEADVENFQLEGVSPHAVDLNTEFLARFDRRFQLITAIEVVEHLDCPRHFLRQARQLLDENGFLLVTTPNLSHWTSRVGFLVHGELRMFRKRDYIQRHISPITHVQMLLMLGEIGFRMVDFAAAGSCWGPIKRFVRGPVSLLFRLLVGPRAWGDVSLYLVRISEPGQAARHHDALYP